MRSASTLSRDAVLIGVPTLGLALPSGALAASAGTGEKTPLHLTGSAVHHASSSGGSILRTIIALAIVIGLIYAVARVLKAVKGGGSGQASGEGLTHLATLPLSTGRSVALVRSGSDVVLVGISESGVTPIKVYTEAEAITNGILGRVGDSSEVSMGAVESSPGFLDSLRRMTVRI